MSRQAEALPLYEKLVTEFEQSTYLEDAKKRIDAIKSGAPLPGAPAATAAVKPPS